MFDPLPFESLLAGRRVLVTGHTGFKGGWLALWLTRLGADVHGMALAPESRPNLFEAIRLKDSISHNVQDLRDGRAVMERIRAIDPEVVFHLAAQSLVRRSYDKPLETFHTNILGTAHVLEACRHSASTKAIVCVTTDKVYENREWWWAYREIDRLGGDDPYSASKAASELVSSCYRNIFAADDNGLALATARGGNVIGGGDWCEDRLIPDLVRAITSHEHLAVRNPRATRPWQHVLALCHGYLQLASGLIADPEDYQEAWNFGPRGHEVLSVEDLLECFDKAWTLPPIVKQPASGRPESQRLHVDSTKAFNKLGWVPPWTLHDAVARTADWYKGYYFAPSDAQSLTLNQIAAYRGELTALGNQDRKGDT